MLRNPSKKYQANLCYSMLRDMLDCNDPLIVLADSIDWQYFIIHLRDIIAIKEDQLNLFV